ncbi:hypothetical protein ACFL5Z_09435 [Planctomycetota bacterium]
MTDEEIYRKAIGELFQTCGKFEHDEKKAIELFDKLLDRGIESHCDVVKAFCMGVGYDKEISKEIAKIYDIISLYKDHKESPNEYWDIDKLLSD